MPETRKVGDEVIWIDGSSIEEVYSERFNGPSEFIVDRRTRSVYRRGDGP